MRYKQMVDKLKASFTTITFEQIPRDQNRVADAMATIASLLNLPQNSTRYEFLVEQLWIPAYDIPESKMICCLVGSESPWYGEFYTYLRDHTLPPNQSNNQRKIFIRQTARYTIIVETLYRRSLDGTLL
ncbi:hypothetical protein SUGI_1143560 [Cryptomeria japonica]|nr:hypothetical protein SUGI_1143560 [Cryptomeria japonica]